MPTALDLGQSKHAAAATHVVISTLACTVSAAARDTRDTGNSATSTPGLDEGLVASGPKDGVAWREFLEMSRDERLGGCRGGLGLS